MWKDVREIICKLIVLILPFFILLPLYCSLFQSWYLDDEYAMYQQQKDYVSGKMDADKVRVLVMGDSRTKAGFHPMLLWEGTYNIALGGATPIEGYYSLKEYLSNHEPPETVVMAYAPMHYMDVDTLWKRSVYFHTLDKADFKDLTKRAKQFEDTESILIENYKTEYLMYQLYLPNKYATALKKSLFVTRREKTEQKYDMMVESKGYTMYGTAAQADGINGEAKVSDFSESDIITWYLGETFRLCETYGIQVVLEQTPMNETSYRILTPEFKEHYRSYMYGLAQQYPEVLIYPDFYCYPNDCFGDPSHLNTHGAQVFDDFLKQKYGNM